MGNAAGCISASADKHKQNFKVKKHAAEERYKSRQVDTPGSSKTTYVNSDPEPLQGALSITVVEARALPKLHDKLSSTDAQGMGAPITSMASASNPQYDANPLSPFVVVYYGGESFETQTISSDHPVWEQTHHILVRKTEMEGPLRIELFNISSLTRYQLLGTAELNAQDFMDQKPHDIWVELRQVTDARGRKRDKKKKATLYSGGEIRLRIQLVCTKEIEDIFWANFADVYDWDRNGVVSHLELRLMLEGLGSSLTDDKIDGLIETWIAENPDKGVEIPIPELSNIMRQSREQHLIHMTRCPICSQPITRKSRPQKLSSNSGLGQRMPGHTEADGHRSREGLRWGKSQWEGETGREGIYKHIGESANSTQPDTYTSGRLRGQDVAEITEDIDVIVHVSNCIQSHPNLAFSVSGGFLWDVVEYKGWLTKMAGWAHDHPIKQDTGGLVVSDRETGALVEEKIPPYDKIALRALYTITYGGRVGDPLEILRNVTTQVGGKFAEPSSRKHIQPFINFYNIDTSDFLDDPETFPSFNAFFHRKLRPHSRPISSPYNHRIGVCPADSRVLVFDSIDQAQKMWIKGNKFTLAELLQSEPLAREYHNGAVAMFRLGPSDCHRFFVPITSTLGETRVIAGESCTVNPIAVREGVPVPQMNKRVVTLLNSVEFGTVLYVVVGACMMSSIEITSKAGDRVKKGDEHGYFAFGGSLVMLIFRPNSVVFADDLLSNSNRPIETYVKMGTPLCVAKQE
eukprot:TRINITY_DN6255_c0_g1_i1.p1 TRINITY_DN6255_c0_g1~~TRINITY_DN6255_c0_g1_i1.p1  ORF type:complete len:745 (-),score=185.81 TRINITY_DN6255_c0_g1_i1:990-3224(-)